MLYTVPYLYVVAWGAPNENKTQTSIYFFSLWSWRIIFRTRGAKLSFTITVQLNFVNFVVAAIHLFFHLMHDILIKIPFNVMSCAVNS